MLWLEKECTWNVCFERSGTSQQECLRGNVRMHIIYIYIRGKYQKERKRNSRGKVIMKFLSRKNCSDQRVEGGVVAATRRSAQCVQLLKACIYPQHFLKLKKLILIITKKKTSQHPLHNIQQSTQSRSRYLNLRSLVSRPGSKYISLKRSVKF